jgi:hypothetical protein
MVVTSITVVDLPQAHSRPLRARLGRIVARRRSRLAAVVAAGFAAVAATILIALLSGPTTGAAEGHRAQALIPSQRAAIAKALGYPYPLRCLTIAVFADDPDYATAEIDRTSGCAVNRGYVSATLHRIGRTWRLVLDEGQLYVPNGALGEPAAGASTVSSPLGCLSAAVLVQDPSFARAGLARGVCAPPRPSPAGASR